MSMFFAPRFQILDVAGRPVVGAQLLFFAAGTTTPITVYSDAALTVPLPQPVVDISSGIFPAIYTPAGLYKARLLDSNDVLIWEQDNIDPAVSTSLGAVPIAQGGTGATTAATARANLGAASASALTALQVDVSTNYYSKIAYPIATQAEALAGTADNRLMTPLKVKQIFNARGIPPQLWLRDEKASGTDGGSASAGINIRNISVAKINTASFVLTATRFTLPAGTWWVYFSAPAFQVSNHKATLYDVTSAAIVEVGSTDYSSSGALYATTRSSGWAYITNTVSMTIELQHYTQSARVNTGLGIATSMAGALEVYSEVMVWQVA